MERGGKGARVDFCTEKNVNISLTGQIYNIRECLHIWKLLGDFLYCLDQTIR